MAPSLTVLAFTILNACCVPNPVQGSQGTKKIKRNRKPPRCSSSLQFLEISGWKCQTPVLQSRLWLCHSGIRILTETVSHPFPWPALFCLAPWRQVPSVLPWTRNAPVVEDCVVAAWPEAPPLGDFSFLCWQVLGAQWVLWTHSSFLELRDRMWQRWSVPSFCTTESRSPLGYPCCINSGNPAAWSPSVLAVCSFLILIWVKGRKSS